MSSQPTSGQTLTAFYEAVRRKDIPAARRFLADDLVFVGLFETYPNRDGYLAAPRRTRYVFTPSRPPAARSDWRCPTSFSSSSSS